MPVICGNSMVGNNIHTFGNWHKREAPVETGAVTKTNCL